MSMRNVTIRIDKDHEEKFDAIVHQLEKSGLSEAAPVKRFLMVSGRADEKAISRLSELEGIASVRPEQIYSAL
jgi:hypothetical protein